MKENKEPKVCKMTPEQIAFYNGKQRLDQFKEKRASGESLTWEEEREEDEIKTKLLFSIIPFGMKEAQKVFQNYRMDSEAYPDTMQSLALKCCEKLNNYDPNFSAPTVFYVLHFKEVIFNYLSANTIHLSKYDSKNARLVCQAIDYYEAQGNTWTVDLIARHTGLSEKVVSSTLRYKQSAKYTSIEDQEALQLVSTNLSPEKLFFEQDHERSIVTEIQATLNDTELRIFLLRLNLDDLEFGNMKIRVSSRSPKKSFYQIHLETGLPLKDVKSIYRRAILKLRNNKILCEELNHHKTNK